MNRRVLLEHARGDLVTQRTEAAGTEAAAAVPRQFVRAICEHREPLGDSGKGQGGQASLPESSIREHLENLQALILPLTSGPRLRGLSVAGPS